MGEGADEDDHIPDLLVVLATGFAGHLAAAVLNDVEELAVGEVAE